MIPWIDPENPLFPPVSTALRDPDGLLCAGGNLDSSTLQRAYRAGIFPWYGEDEPILWWAPDPRMVLFPQELHVARRLKKTLRTGALTATADRAFAEVMRQCAAPRSRSPGTWINADMFDAYCTLHQEGVAHSIEIWQQEELVGGLYGLLIGRVFFGESMFSRINDASKAALLALTHWLAPLDCPLIDCQVYNPHLERLGARLIPRQRFCDYLNHYTQAEPGSPTPPSDFSLALASLFATESV